MESKVWRIYFEGLKIVSKARWYNNWKKTVAILRKFPALYLPSTFVYRFFLFLTDDLRHSDWNFLPPPKKRMRSKNSPRIMSVKMIAYVLTIPFSSWQNVTLGIFLSEVQLIFLHFSGFRTKWIEHIRTYYLHIAGCGGAQIDKCLFQRHLSEANSLFFIIQCFRSIVFIFIFTTFRPICDTFFRCSSNSGPTRNFEPRHSFNPRRSLILILLTITGYKS